MATSTQQCIALAVQQHGIHDQSRHLESHLVLYYHAMVYSNSRQTNSHVNFDNSYVGSDSIKEYFRMRGFGIPAQQMPQVFYNNQCILLNTHLPIYQ